MRIDFNVNISDQTKGVSAQGFGMTLVFDSDNEIPYMEIGSPSDLTDLVDEVTSDSRVYKIVQKLFMAKPGPQTVAVFGETCSTKTEVLDALDSLINQQNGDWFNLTVTDNSSEYLIALSDWALANDKILYATTQDIGLLESIESKNAFIGYHDNEDDLFVEGLASNMSVALPGSKTAKFEEIQGSLPAQINLTELRELEKHNGASYIKTMGRNYVSEGKTTDGSYLDIVLGGYFIKFRIQEALFLLAMNNDKVGYADTGIGMQVAEVDTVMKTAVAQGIILEENGKGVYTINALTRDEMPTNEVANRNYDGISVVAVVDGAIHSGDIGINLVLNKEEK